MGNSVLLQLYEDFVLVRLASSFKTGRGLFKYRSLALTFL